MMERKIPCKSGDEYDALSWKARDVLSYRTGERKAIKNGYRRRLRQSQKREIDITMIDDRLTAEELDALYQVYEGEESEYSR